MAKINLAILYGIIKDKPQIRQNAETGEYISGLCYIHLVRGYRDAHDNKQYVKHDYPLVVSFDQKIIAEMSGWAENDVVLIKGTITTKIVNKSSKCVMCKDENGKPTVNEHKGLILYVTPIFAQRQKSFLTKENAIEHVFASREISNMAYLAGTLIRDPVLFKTKAGEIITQYQLALNRKFRIREDDPEIRTDWPWVKSYGEQAIEDKLRLRMSSNVIIDGFLQTRHVVRKCKCEKCGQIYEWEDTSMEIVPYDTEYIHGTYLTDDEIEADGRTPEEMRQEVGAFLEKNKDEMEEDFNSEEIDPGSVKKPVLP